MEATAGKSDLMDSEEIDFGSDTFSGQAAEVDTNVEADQKAVNDIQQEEDNEGLSEAASNNPEQMENADTEVTTEQTPALPEADVEIEEERHVDEDLADAEVIESEDVNEPAAAASKSTETKKAEPRLVQFPLAKVKQIIKLDADVHMVSSEAIFLITRAAELFAQNLAKESYSYTVAGKKKTISKRDVEMTIESVGTLSFLEGMMNV